MMSKTYHSFILSAADVRSFLVSFLAIGVTGLCLAGGAAAQLSKEKQEWPKTAVQFLMTKEERSDWSKVKSDADADKFIKLFWLRRDPTPGTPQNELRDEIETRIKIADQRMSEGKKKGSITDRGKIIVIFGVPTRAERRRPDATLATARSSGATPNRTDGQSLGSEQVWIYEGDIAQKSFGKQKVELVFSDESASGEYSLVKPGFNLSDAQDKMVRGYIASPNLTLADVDTASTTVAPVQPVAGPPSTAFKTAAFESAVADAKKTPAANAKIAYTEFVSPSGDPYVSIGVYLAKASGLAADAADTVFIAVDDAAGNRVMAIEQPYKLNSSKGDVFADRSLTLPAGKYDIVFGLAKGTTSVLAATAPIEVKSPAKDAAGVSRLLLTNNLYELPDAQPEKSPFAFGKFKIVPRADGLFSNKEDLNYFVEIDNPGIDTASNTPKVQVGIDLMAGGQILSRLPMMDTPLIPLSGKPGPGHYVLSDAIGFSKMAKPLAPGDYSLKVNILDTITKQTYTVEQAFKVVN